MRGRYFLLYYSFIYTNRVPLPSLCQIKCLRPCSSNCKNNDVGETVCIL